jgi:uncharacterized protein (DUF1499 family)
MLQSGFAVFVSLFLALLSWLGTAAPVAAQPAALLSTAPTVEIPAEIAMARKSLFSFSSKPPTNLGVKDGKLAACPKTPNCVNSQTDATDAEHKIAPIAYNSAPAEVMTKLKSVIEGMERTEVVTQTSDYLYAEFTSALMGFVDDVEFYLDPSTPGQLHVRSASRLGQSDMGVNRKRIEEIRAKLAELEA